MINAYTSPVAPAAVLTGQRVDTLGLLILLVLVLITSSITGAVIAPA